MRNLLVKLGLLKPLVEKEVSALEFYTRLRDILIEQESSGFCSALRDYQRLYGKAIPLEDCKRLIAVFSRRNPSQHYSWIKGHTAYWFSGPRSLDKRISLISAVIRELEVEPYVK